MSALDPTVATPFSNTRSLALPYERLAALAKGLPLPKGGGGTSSGGGGVSLTINVTPGGPRKVCLELTRKGKAAAAVKPADSVNTVADTVKKDKAEKYAEKAKAKAAEKAAASAAAPKAAAAPATPKPGASASSVVAVPVPKDEPARLDAAEIAGCQVAQDVSEIQARLQKEMDVLGLSSGKFWRVRSDYYEQALVWRRDVLGAASVQQLCKSMIMENTKVGDLTLEQAQAAGRIKYICVVLQYAGAKLQKEKLTEVVRKMEGKAAVGKKQYSIRMVSQDVSDALSGFEHNAVTPLGMKSPVPVVLSHYLKKLPDAQLWMGGGEVDLKLRFDVGELLSKFTPAGWPLNFADVTEE